VFSGLTVLSDDLRSGRIATTVFVERGGDDLGFAGAGGVVGVAHGRVDVLVAHPLLQGPHRDAGGRNLGAEPVA
jgi:hypothetical protein